MQVRRFLAWVLVAGGGLLVLGPATYVGYGFLADRGLEERLTVEVEAGAEVLLEEAWEPVPVPVSPTPEGSPGELEEAPGSSVPEDPSPLLGGVALLPARLLPVQAWADPGGYRPRRDLLPEDLEDYRPVALGETWPQERALRIRIPAIGVDAEVKELEVVEVGDSRAWETPAFVVGHIPTTPFPGQPGSGWYFGHLESPIRNEGNVFFRLPEIPDLLRRGEPVFVVLETASRRFLYRVYRTRVVPQEELVVRSEGTLSEIQLVACVPRFIYDHRLIVTARLVGVAEGGRG